MYGKEQHMTKRLITTFLILVLLITGVVGGYSFAFESEAYYKPISIGLWSLQSNTFTLTLTGEYKYGEVTYPSGKVIEVSFDGTDITFDGKLYASESLVPSNSDNVLKIFSKDKNATRHYKGSVSFTTYGTKIIPVNTLDLETYLKGVVSGEMPEYFGMEALKAQAIAARTYAVKYYNKRVYSGYNLDDTTSSQVYYGYDPDYVNGSKAVDATKGMILTYNGAPAETLYSATHGGYTERVENVWGSPIPYLIDKADSYDLIYPWTEVLTSAQIDDTLRRRGYLAEDELFKGIDVDSMTFFPSGRISNIDVFYFKADGTEAKISFSRNSARTFIGMKSAMYTVKYYPDSDEYAFTGKGYGHGVGMSQWGARKRAEAGQSYAQILAFYYPGTEIMNPKVVLRNLTADRRAFTGDVVTIKTDTVNGSGDGYEHRYVIKQGTAVIKDTGYVRDIMLFHTFAKAGEYTVQVFARDVNLDEGYEDSKTLNISVFSRPVITSLSVQDVPTAGATASRITANTSGGSSLGLTYTYVLTNAGKEVDRKVTASNVYDFTPALVGSYNLTVSVKDGLSGNTVDSTKSITLEGYKMPVLGNIVLNKLQSLEGQPVRISSSSTGGSGAGVQYKFVVSYAGATKYTRNFSSAAYIDYTPPTHGNYNVKVYVKDAKSASSYDSMKELNFTIKEDFVKTMASKYSIAAPVKMYDRGSNTVSLQTALKDLGYYRYSVDGIFGRLTQGAVITAQTASGLSATGTVDSATLNAIYSQLAARVSSTNTSANTTTTTTVSNMGITRTLSYGSRGSDVKILQNALNKLGFSVGTADGIFGRMTKNGVIGFQKANGISASGTADANTVKAIAKKLGLVTTTTTTTTTNTNTNTTTNTSTTSASKLAYSRLLKYGSRGTDVKALQAALNKLGFSCGTPDGVFGYKTKTAVMAFQRRYGLSVDGLAGRATINKINGLL